MRKRILPILLAAVLLLGLLAGCAGGGSGSGGGAINTKRPEYGPDTNNGRPFNATPVAYDNRQDKYLNGVNLTILPVVDKEVTIDIWREFDSTVMTGLDESLVFQEMERRTNVKINWLYPPVDQRQENFTLRIASDDLPHIFSTPPEYPGGPAKAIDDEIYLELTPYLENGLMPNTEYLMGAHPELARDLVDDAGRLIAFTMIDIVPSHPWSGLWVRQDALDDLGLAAPVTLDDWDTMLYAMRDMTGSFVLGNNFPDWYGIQTNYQFAGAFGASFRRFINKAGTVAYGSIEPGYRDFLTLMNKWYADGILDPDFATRTFDDYRANCSDGSYLAFGMAYGELGQNKLNGITLNPRWKVIPVYNPVLNLGDPVNLAQSNSTVRSDYEYMTTRAVDDGLDEIIAVWKDYWFSQDGGDLCSYGVEGESYVWNSQGTFDFIWPGLDAADSDFWTLFPLFKLHNWSYLRDSTSYENEQEVWDCIDLWSDHEVAWLMPDAISFTPEEAKELADIVVNVETYVEEMSFRFVVGTAPLSEYDDYVETIKSFGIDRAIEINQAALNRYLAR